MELDAKTRNYILLGAGVIGALAAVMQVSRQGRSAPSVIPLGGDPRAVLDQEREKDRQTAKEIASINAGVTSLELDFSGTMADRLSEQNLASSSTIPVTAVMFGNLGQTTQTNMQAVTPTPQGSSGPSFGPLGNIPVGSAAGVPITPNAIGQAVSGIGGLVRGLFGGGGGSRNNTFRPNERIIRELKGEEVRQATSASQRESMRIQDQTRRVAFRGNSEALNSIIRGFGGTLPTS